MSEYRRGQRVFLKADHLGQVVGLGPEFRKAAIEIPAGEEFQFFRQFDRDGETHYAFHTGGEYVGRRYIITTEPGPLFDKTAPVT